MSYFTTKRYSLNVGWLGYMAALAVALNTTPGWDVAIMLCVFLDSLSVEVSND